MIPESDWADAPSVHFLFPAPASDRKADVERVNHFPLYELGKSLQRLASVLEPDEINVRRLYTPFRNSMAALDGLLNGNPFPLGISKKAAADLKIAIEEEFTFRFVKYDGKKQKITFPDSNIKADSWEFSTITHALSKFELIFSTEMSELSTYFVPQRGIYSTPALIDSADKSFPSAVFGHVPDKARADWRSAGRCLAFNLLSATGYHVARAVEATLEVYYQLYTGDTRTLNGWNDYIKTLESVAASGSSPSPATKTMGELRQMKDDYRNPLVHPRVTLTENEARMLFDNGESLIIAMAEEIKAIREAGGVQGSLAVVGGSSVDEDIPF